MDSSKIYDALAHFCQELEGIDYSALSRQELRKYQYGDFTIIHPAHFLGFFLGQLYDGKKVRRYNGDGYIQEFEIIGEENAQDRFIELRIAGKVSSSVHLEPLLEWIGSCLAEASNANIDPDVGVKAHLENGELVFTCARMFQSTLRFRIRAADLLFKFEDHVKDIERNLKAFGTDDAYAVVLPLAGSAKQRSDNKIVFRADRASSIWFYPDAHYTVRAPQIRAIYTILLNFLTRGRLE